MADETDLLLGIIDSLTDSQLEKATPLKELILKEIADKGERRMTEVIFELIKDNKYSNSEIIDSCEELVRDKVIVFRSDADGYKVYSIASS